MGGQHLANCGNSGNSTEPHLHFQLQDRPSVLVAAGLPMRLTWSDPDGGRRDGTPPNGQPFVADRGLDGRGP